MFTNDQWTMTNFGPVQVEQLADKPHIAVGYDGSNGTNLRGYTVRGVEDYVTVMAQGHQINLGLRHPIYLNDTLALPAGMVQKGHEIEIRPLQGVKWKGTGGNDSGGELMGELFSRFGNAFSPEDEKEAQRYLIQNQDVLLLNNDSRWIIDCWNDSRRIERKSSEFYKGFLRTAILDQVKSDGVYYVDNAAGNLIAQQVLRMLLRIGIFAFASDHRIVVPSYSLRQLIMTVGFGKQGTYLLPEVDSVTSPQKYTVTVERVINSKSPQKLFGTSGIFAGSLTEINSFLVATEGL